MLRIVVRGILLALLATTLSLAVNAPAQAEDLPAKVTKTLDKLGCKNPETYDAEKPIALAVQCHLTGKGKKLGTDENGRTNLSLFKSAKVGKEFWAAWLDGCGECYIVKVGRVFIAGGGGYEKDIATYVQKKVGGKILAY